MILKRWRDVSNTDYRPPPTNNAEPWRDTKHRSGWTLASNPQHQITKPLAGFPPCIYTDSDTLRASKFLRSSILFFFVASCVAFRRQRLCITQLVCADVGSWK
jgi:hypothetical protein